MAITSLQIANFKGILEEVRVDLKPITIFLGPNSSGKSTCIHALTVLAQTLTLANNISPLILDDEHAFIHLGRFIEVIHSRSYKDQMVLGLTLEDAEIEVKSLTKEPSIHFTGKREVRYWFKSTLRTQDIQLVRAEFCWGDNHTFVATPSNPSSDVYHVRHTQSGVMARFVRRSGFLLYQDFISQASRRVFLGLIKMQGELQRHLLDSHYLGPFRQSPRRRYSTRGSTPTDVGAEGEATITLIANERIKTQRKGHINKIASWLDVLGLAKKLTVSRIGTSDLFNVDFMLDDGEDFSIADLGYGLSQVLPVLTQCSFALPGSTLLFEQPELHLHSIPARNLAKVFTQTANSGVRLLIETHSPDLFKGFQDQIRDEALGVDDVAVYRICREAKRTLIKKLKIEPDADIYENWQKGLTTE